MKLPLPMWSYVHDLLQRHEAKRYAAQIARGIAEWWINQAKRILRYLPIPIANMCFIYALLKIRIAYWSDDKEFFTSNYAAADLLEAFFYLAMPGLVSLFLMRRRPVMPWVLLAFIGLWTAMVAEGRLFYVDGRHGCLDCEIASLLIGIITWPALLTVLVVKGFRLLDRLLSQMEARDAERNKPEGASPRGGSGAQQTGTPS